MSKANTDLVKALNIEDILSNDNKRKVNMSGGEMQKVELLSLVANRQEYDFVFMDEFTNSLDNESINELYNYINKHFDNCGVVIISHDENIKNEIHFDYIYDINN